MRAGVRWWESLRCSHFVPSVLLLLASLQLLLIQIAHLKINCVPDCITPVYIHTCAIVL